MIEVPLSVLPSCLLQDGMLRFNPECLGPYGGPQEGDASS